MNNQDTSMRRERIHEILKESEPKRENLIPLLSKIQDNEDFHYIPDEAIEEVAHYVNISPSEVYGVISFYSMFSTEPRGKYIIRVCRSAPCHVMGCTTVMDLLKELLNIKVGETTEDHLFTLETSSCQGVCDRAPAMMINDRVYGNLTREKIEEIIGGIL